MDGQHGAAAHASAAQLDILDLLAANQQVRHQRHEIEHQPAYRGDDDRQLPGQRVDLPAERLQLLDGREIAAQAGQHGIQRALPAAHAIQQAIDLRRAHPRAIEHQEPGRLIDGAFRPGQHALQVRRQHQQHGVEVLGREDPGGVVGTDRTPKRRDF